MLPPFGMYKLYIVCLLFSNKLVKLQIPKTNPSNIFKFISILHT